MLKLCYHLDPVLRDGGYLLSVGRFIYLHSGNSVENTYRKQHLERIRSWV